ncbi:MAG: cupin domain-containing protein [Candidatus Caldarchaeum sp.]
MASAQVFRWDDIPWERLREDVWRRLIVGDRMMLAQFWIRKGAKVAMHRHHNEQISLVLSGAMKFVLENGSEHLVREGGVFVIPSNVVHAAEAVEDSVVVDVFSPPRDDWLRGDDAYLRRS